MLWLAATDQDCHRFSYAAATVVVVDHALATASYYIVKIDRNPSSWPDNDIQGLQRNWNRRIDIWQLILGSFAEHWWN